jgi:hypothetical protein
VASDVGVGDIEVPFLDVQPGDGTTEGTLAVTAPEGGTDATPDVTAGTPTDGVVRLTAAAVTYDAPGRWVLHWQVTGTGASAEDVEVYVVASPVAGGPTWVPGRSRVANYLFGRTLARDVETHLYTWDSTTMPTGVQADRLIADAVATVQARTGEIDEGLYDAAAACCAVLAACAIERAYPARSEEQSLARARDLCQQGQQMLGDLVKANQQPDDPGAGGTNLLPLYAFPAPPAWGDETFL